MSKILIISEGTNPDKKIIEYLLKIYRNKDIQYQIETYDTNVYMLYDEIKKEYNDEIEDIQIIPILKQKKDNFKFNKNEFSEIYLFFDYDIHHNEFLGHENFDILNEQLKEMLQYFNDETGDRGKLYINYPMVEAFFHVNLNDNNKLKDLHIDLSLVKNYKKTPEINKLKGQFNQNCDNFDLEKINLICKQHVMKENFIINGEYLVPEYSNYSNLNQSFIFKNQLIKYVSIGKISVLSIFPRFIIDYFGEDKFEKITS
ncbi:MAG: hypothetical protein ACRC0F_00040 [Cetobacterium sp.]